jgi:NAD(P)-dependent dehydrogenase (short-subunit alcohol dehydrogenase family)
LACYRETAKDCLEWNPDVVDLPEVIDAKFTYIPPLRERTPMGRLGNVVELNNLAVFLASDASTYGTESDVVIDVS